MVIKYTNCRVRFICHTLHSQALIVQDEPLVSLFGVSWSHTYRHTVGSFGRVISPSQSPLPTQDNTTYKHKRQTSMPRTGFEPATPATKRPQTYSLDRAHLSQDTLNTQMRVLLTPWRQNQKIHHRIHKSPPPDHMLRQLNSLHPPPPSITRKMNIGHYRALLECRAGSGRVGARAG
jgi:hypothetical protein